LQRVGTKAVWDIGTVGLTIKRKKQNPSHGLKNKKTQGGSKEGKITPNILRRIKTKRKQAQKRGGKRSVGDTRGVAETSDFR